MASTLLMAVIVLDIPGQNGTLAESCGSISGRSYVPLRGGADPGLELSRLKKRS
jgi:hypothetical protein